MYESLSQSDNDATLSVNVDPRNETHAANREADLVERVVGLLAGERAGLVTDVDGTISPIVAQPEDAVVLPRAREALEGLSEILELVAVVSGRRAADARAMVGVDRLAYVGNHGLEICNQLGEPETVAEARPWVPRLAAVLDNISRQLPQSGIQVENKGATASLHYRRAPDPDRARLKLLDILAHSAITSGLRLEEGRMVLNLLPPLTVTKGSAVTWLVRQHHLQRLVYLGDDVTDAHAFRSLAVLRDTGQAQTLSIGVVGRETPLSVRQLADAHVPSVEAVADLLCEVLGRLRSAGVGHGRP